MTTNTPTKKVYSQAIIKVVRDKPVKRESRKLIDAKAFANFLVKQKTVKLAGVGIFELIIKKPYMGYNPALKKRTLIEGGVRVNFRPIRSLKQTIKDNVKTKSSKVAK